VPRRRPFRPTFGHDDEKRLIEAMRELRGLAGMCAAASGFGSRRYQLVQALAHAIDALAQDLTGDPALFAAKPHGG
jgi:hypothetical protein